MQILLNTMEKKLIWLLFEICLRERNQKKNKPRILKLILAKVKGNLVSTQKNSYLVGQKLLLVHPIDLESNFIGKNDVVAIDVAEAGIGDTVLWLAKLQKIDEYFEAVAVLSQVDGVGRSAENRYLRSF